MWVVIFLQFISYSVETTVFVVHGGEVQILDRPLTPATDSQIISEFKDYYTEHPDAYFRFQQFVAQRQISAHPLFERQDIESQSDATLLEDQVRTRGNSWGGKAARAAIETEGCFNQARKVILKEAFVSMRKDDQKVFELLTKGTFNPRGKENTFRYVPPKHRKGSQLPMAKTDQGVWGFLDENENIWVPCGIPRHPCHSTIEFDVQLSRKSGRGSRNDYINAQIDLKMVDDFMQDKGLLAKK